jgi:hypothetical protein
MPHGHSVPSIRTLIPHLLIPFLEGNAEGSGLLTWLEPNTFWAWTGTTQRSLTLAGPAHPHPHLLVLMLACQRDGMLGTL